MNQWRKYLVDHQLISWLLIFALVLQFLIQLQIHVHHEHHSNLIETETHTIDFHPITDQHDSDEHSSSHEVHELKSTPDFIIKKIQNTDPGPVLITLFIIFTAVPLTLTHLNWVSPGKFFVRNSYYGLSPPTRGPPLSL